MIQLLKAIVDSSNCSDMGKKKKLQGYGKYFTHNSSIIKQSVLKIKLSKKKTGCRERLNMYATIGIKVSGTIIICIKSYLNQLQCSITVQKKLYTCFAYTKSCCD